MNRTFHYGRTAVKGYIGWEGRGLEDQKAGKQAAKNVRCVLTDVKTGLDRIISKSDRTIEDENLECWEKI